MRNNEMGLLGGHGARVMKQIVLTFLFLTALFLIPGTGTPLQTVSADSNCATSSPPSGSYNVTLCFGSLPNNLNGDVAINMTVSVTQLNPKVQSILFTLNNNYLLTDYQSPYVFALPTTHFVDGSYTLSASALMRDGYNTEPTAITLNFSNGISSPPVNRKKFTPALGTPRANGSPLVVAAVGDGAGGEANARKVTALIGSWNPNLLLYLGDVYEKGSPIEFYNWYGTSQDYAVFRSITDPTIGNHEYTADKNAAGYFDYWNNIPNYYSYTTAGWHFISLNANSINGKVQTKPGTPQYDWLVQDLTSNTAACTLVYWHQPLFNIGGEAPQKNLEPIWALLAQHKVDIVLNGHDHDYQRWMPLDGAGNPSPAGVTEIIVGSGGHGIQGFTKSDPRMVTGFDSSTKPPPFGALRLDLTPTQAQFSFINIAGALLDSGSIACHNAGSASAAQPAGPVNAAPVTQPDLSISPDLLLNNQRFSNLICKNIIQ